MQVGSREKEKGSLTIEATIALIAFLFFFLMVYNIITLCRAQANIQMAINNAAKEISYYSYLYGLTGLDKSLSSLEQAGLDRQGQANDLVGQVADVFSAIQKLAGKAGNIDLGSWDDITSMTQEVQGTGDALASLWQTMKSKSSDPMAILFGLGKIMASQGWAATKTYLIAAPISRLIVQKHLRRNAADTAEAFCRSLGIVKGSYFGEESYFNGLDFSYSELFPATTNKDNPRDQEISIVVVYKIKVIPLLPINLEFSVTQKAQTRGWLHGDAS